MNDIERFQQYLQLANQLVNFATKDNLAECVKLLAINIAHYESVHGTLPQDDTLQTTYSEKPNPLEIILMTKGMETMVGVLGGIVQGFEPEQSR